MAEFLNMREETSLAGKTASAKIHEASHIVGSLKQATAS
jgi:hypothetical protein